MNIRELLMNIRDSFADGRNKFAHVCKVFFAKYVRTVGGVKNILT